MGAEGRSQECSLEPARAEESPRQSRNAAGPGEMKRSRVTAIMDFAEEAKG